MAPENPATEKVRDEDSLEDLRAAHEMRHAHTPTVDAVDPTEADGFELPGAMLTGEELRVDLDPIHTWEFTCTGCFLVRDRVQRRQRDPDLCVDCL